jgi:hypothetical protein
VHFRAHTRIFREPIRDARKQYIFRKLNNDLHIFVRHQIWRLMCESVNKAEKFGRGKPCARGDKKSTALDGTT